MMNETVLLESQTLRNELCKDENLRVLDRVGQLSTLSETDYALTQGVSDFYETTLKTVQTTVRRHRDELKLDGYKSLSRKDFGDLHHEGLKSKARKIAIFLRRAVLRIGMLLRDSKVAKQVRSYLLNVESQSSFRSLSQAGELQGKLDQGKAEAMMGEGALRTSRTTDLYGAHVYGNFERTICDFSKMKGDGRGVNNDG